MLTTLQGVIMKDREPVTMMAIAHLYQMAAEIRVGLFGGIGNAFMAHTGQPLDIEGEDDDESRNSGYYGFGRAALLAGWQTATSTPQSGSGHDR